jgi:hypothetical protein
MVQCVSDGLFPSHGAPLLPCCLKRCLVSLARRWGDHRVPCNKVLEQMVREEYPDPFIFVSVPWKGVE